MNGYKCTRWEGESGRGEIFECPKCGNHVCAECARKNMYVCPHCFAGLKRIN